MQNVARNVAGWSSYHQKIGSGSLPARSILTGAAIRLKVLKSKYAIQIETHHLLRVMIIEWMRKQIAQACYRVARLNGGVQLRHDRRGDDRDRLPTRAVRDHAHRRRMARGHDPGARRSTAIDRVRLQPAGQSRPPAPRPAPGPFSNGVQHLRKTRKVIARAGNVLAEEQRVEHQHALSTVHIVGCLDQHGRAPRVGDQQSRASVLRPHRGLKKHPGCG